MFRKLVLAAAMLSALTLGAASPRAASAHWGHHHHHHGHYGRVIYPPVYIGGYYPVRTYYSTPYYGPYGPYYGSPYVGYYRSGTVFSVGW
jgi:hypothetical protein